MYVCTVSTTIRVVMMIITGTPTMCGKGGRGCLSSHSYGTPRVPCWPIRKTKSMHVPHADLACLLQHARWRRKVALLWQRVRPPCRRRAVKAIAVARLPLASPSADGHHSDQRLIVQDGVSVVAKASADIARRRRAAVKDNVHATSVRRTSGTMEQHSTNRTGEILSDTTWQAATFCSRCRPAAGFVHLL